jgi:hypothetical protein
MPNEARTNLELLPSEVLFNLARNPAAVERMLAIQILVERGSEFATKPDISLEAEQFIIDHPRILAKIDPAGTLMAAQKLPGLVDVVACEQERRRALAATVDEHHGAHTQNHAALSTTVADHKAASGQALRDAFVNLWTYFARQNWQITEDAAAQKAAFDKEIATLQEVHARDVQAAAERLRLLERSIWRKLVDWVHARWSRLRKPKADPVLIEQEDEAAFQNRLADMVRTA